MELLIYPRLSTCSRRAMKKVNKRRGWKAKSNYTPRQMLIDRLVRELKLPEDTIRQQIEKERIYLIEQSRGQ